MKLRYETISPALHSILTAIMQSECFTDFRLVGGTALSLQRGHRRSIDIDMFTDLPYGKMPTEAICSFLETRFSTHYGTESLKQTAMGYSLRLGEQDGPVIKVDLFYTDSFIFLPIVEDGIRMADQREIAAMKLSAICGPIKRQKDFWDIHDLLSDFTLEEMIGWAIKRHPFSLSEDEIINALSKTNEIEESPEGIDSLRHLDFWELIVMDLENTLIEYNK